MLRLSDIRIRPKLLYLFIQTGLFPVLVVGFLYSYWTEKSLIEKSFDNLTTIQTIRKGQIENHFGRSFVDIRLLADSERIYNFVRQIGPYREKMVASSPSGLFDTSSAEYRALVGGIAKQLQDYAYLNGYSDLYLVDADYGNIVYSVQNQGDNGKNLRHSSLKSSALAEVWNEVMASSATVISDFSPYAPAEGREVAFIGHPVTNLLGEKIAVVILRFNENLISTITESRKGMGQSGESYLIGREKNGGGFEFRSRLTTMGEGKYVIGYDLGRDLAYWQDAVESGNAGGHGVYTDSAGKTVLVAYDKLNIEGLDWYLISKIDKYEVTAPLRRIYRNLAIFVAFFTLLTGGWAWLLSRGFTRPILRDIEFADAISHGHYDSMLPTDRKDELGDLARSLNEMAVSLKEVNWLKSGKEQLDDAIRGELDPDQLARGCIRFFVHHFEAQLGAIYLNNQGLLELRASHCFSDRQGNFNSFAVGEGMVGQAALESESICFSQMDEGAPAMNYGAGEAPLKHYLAAPIHADEGEVAGVMLIGSMHPFDDLQKKFLNQNIANVAVLFSAARSRMRISELLDEARRQQEELKASNSELERQARALQESEAEMQAQQEELRVTNEELEEQTRALKQSKAELQAQQEELRVTNDELEERSRVLEEQKNQIWATNSDLKEAQEIVERKVEELEVASKYKSEFLANMSHELRTPLNSILILSQLLGANKDGNLTAKQVESARAINSSGSELLKLINEILDLSKIEAGKIDLIIEEVKLVRINEDLHRMYKDIADSKGLDLVFAVAPGLPKKIITDEQRLQQVLRNLITNAFKFTREGTVALEISRPSAAQVAGISLDVENSLAFAVKDEGIGIAAEKQKGIFEAFQQADGSTSRNYGGTGLGLSISRELTRLLGGVILLDSVEGQGSTFTVVLPEKHELSGSGQQTEPEVEGEAGARPAEAAAAQVAVREPDARAAEKETAKGREEVKDDRKEVTPTSKSVLIIEDDNNFSMILRDFARERGFKCIIAEDGETGLHFADYYRPSAVILDIGLPGIDGLNVMERLKNNPSLRHIPVHFMSAADSSMEALRMGAIGYLTKPVSLEKMDETFRKLETMIDKPVSRLLLVEDDTVQRESIRQLIGDSDVKTTAVATGAEAYRELESRSYDCMILDLGLEDMSGFDLLEKIRANEAMSGVPIIIYTGRELSEEEEVKLSRYAESIIIKGVKSPERLLDESALFLHRVEAELPEEKRNMLKMMHDGEGVLSGSRVLLVDDDMRNVFALTSVLEEREIEVIIARDGIECLEKLEEIETVDAVLMDIMMPRKDGYETMREIRKKRQYRDLPIIALTAKAMKGDRSKCIEAGASDYLAKPVDPEKLLSMLRVWLY